MQIERLPPLLSSLQPSDHPHLNGAWTPQLEEINAFDLDIIEGAIPVDIDGVYLRNTENQLHEPLGRYHPFDGDGMIHQIDFNNGKATYRTVSFECAVLRRNKLPTVRFGADLWMGRASQKDPALVRTAA